MAFDFDLFVIGAGSGGLRAARMAAQMGVKVGLAEENALGGTCVNLGCIPKKLMVYASHYAEDINDAYGYGWTVNGFSHNWQQLINNKNQEISRLNVIYHRLLVNAGVSLFSARAYIDSDHVVRMGEKTVTAEKILVCVGGFPTLPDIEGCEYVISSDDVFYLDNRPERVAIVGGGYIACEFSGIFNGLGSDTRLLYRGDQLLRKFDHDMSRFVANEMEKKGVNVHYQTSVVAIEKRDQGLSCLLDNGETLIVDEVLYAIGRTPHTKDLGLENTSVTLDEKGFIQVDDRFQTNAPSIFALGDVIGTPELTPVALAQAMTFVNQQFGDNTRRMSYEAIPTAVLSQPNFASCGLSEEQVMAQGIPVIVYRSEFKLLKHTLSGNCERALMKIIVHKDSDVVLGVHMAGADAGEIIQGFAVVVKAALTKAQMDMTIGIHPTIAEEFVTMRESQYFLNA